MNKSIQSPKLSNYLGIVSPCSTCLNQRSFSDPLTGLPACPRRASQALQSELNNVGLTTIQVEPLSLTGNEDIPNSTSTSFLNPVYSETYNSVLVWVATIADNPNLLESDFNTNTIFCRGKPIIPADHESVYRSKGAWAEGDHLHIQITENQQVLQNNNDVSPILIEGIANKINLSYAAPRVPQDRDYSISGT